MRKFKNIWFSVMMILAIVTSSAGHAFANASSEGSHTTVIPVSDRDIFVGEMNTALSPHFPPTPADGITYNANSITIDAPAKNPAPIMWNAGQIRVPEQARIVLEADAINGTFSAFLLKYGGEALPEPDQLHHDGNRVTATWIVNQRDSFILSVLGIRGSRSGEDPAVITVHSLKVFETSETFVGEMDTSLPPFYPVSPPLYVAYNNNSFTITPPGMNPPSILWNAGQITVPSEARIVMDATVKNGVIKKAFYQKYGNSEVFLPTDTVVEDESVTVTWSVYEESSFVLSSLGIQASRISGTEPAEITVNSLRVWEPLRPEPLVPNALDADAILQTPPVNHAEFRMHNNAMTLFVNDNPLTGQMWSSLVNSNVSDAYLEEVLTGLDYPVVAIPFAVGESRLTRLFPTTWLDDDVYDWSYVEKQANRVLSIRPDAKITLLLAFDGAVWWTDENPDAANPDVDEMENPRYPGPKGIPDYLNPKWKDTSREVLRQLIAYVQTSDWGQSVIGYELFNGTSMDGNFMIPHENERVVQDFRTYLSSKYGNDEALQSAWNDPLVTLETALTSGSDVPPGIILQPSQLQSFFDSRDFLMRQFREVFSDFASVIKEATHERAIVGARTGDFMGNYGWSERWFEVGEDSGWLTPLLQDPNFDYFDVQEPYVGRHLGDGANVPVIPPLAVHLYGKAIYIQNDVRTYLSNEGIGYGRTPDLETTIEKQRHVFANAMTNRTIPYLYQLDFRYNNVDLLAEYKRQEEIFREALTKDRNSVAEVAFVLDPDMRKYLGHDMDYTAPSRYFALFDTAKHLWQRAGVPFDMIFLDQIDELDPYKVYVFSNTWHYTDEQMTMIKNKVLNDGQTAIFLWADGVLSDGGSYSMENISELTGMTIDFSTEERNWSMKATEELADRTDAQLNEEVGLLPVANLDPDSGISDIGSYLFGPSFTISVSEGDGVVPLAQNDGQVTAGYRDHGNYQVIYSASGNLTLPLYELALEEAGVHRYTDSTALFMMNESYLGIHADTTETIQLKFPVAVALKDLFNDTVYPAKKVHFIPVERSHTYLFALEEGVENVDDVEYSTPSYPSYSITSTSEGNGGVSPSSVSIMAGASRTFTFSPDEGYMIADVVVNGKSIGAVASYTFTNLNKNSTIHVVFSPEEENSVDSVMILVKDEVNRGDIINRDTFIPYFIKDGQPVVVALSSFVDKAIHYVAASGVDYFFKDNSKSFSDISSHWAKDDIGFVAARELFQGTADGLYSPEQSITRGMFVTVLNRLGVHGNSRASSGTQFTDVSDVDWFVQAVEWAVENGLVSGFGNGQFGPNEAITREQLAVILNRFMDTWGWKLSDPHAAAEKTVFSDNDEISGWAANAVAKLRLAGLMDGKTGHRFDPKGLVTRAEAAVVFRRLITYLVKDKNE